MVRKEFLVVMIYVMVVMLWLDTTTTGEAAVAISIAKKGCADRCGRVWIPYPFGIGPNCYANQSYEVTCNNSKPFLAAINNLEVLNIDVGSYPYPPGLMVSHPINHDTYTNLLGTPFSFSSENLFVGVGCNIEAQLLSHTPTTIAAQCTSVCNNGSTNSSCSYIYNILESDGICYGINCCQTYIPPFLKTVNVSLSTIGISSSGNMYGFLVDRDWFTQKGFDPTYNLESRDNVPVNLFWRTDEICYGTRNLTDRDEKYSDDYGDCYCEQGRIYIGNPYLQNACPTAGNSCDATSEWLCDNNRVCLCVYRKSNRTIKFAFVVLGSGIGGLLIIMGAWWLRKIIKRRNNAKLKKKLFKRNGGLLLQRQLSTADQGYVENTKMFTSKDLETATDRYNKNRILGHGGQGTVYKGMLTDGKIVAVKKSIKVDEGKVEEFINEVVILSQINHRNVVKLHGCCLETEVPLLVYDFIPNGTLFQYIHDQENEEFPLTWDVRLRIASEVAGALSYLHSAASLPIYHRDIKSSNILMDDKYRAKVADFGTSRSAPVDQTHMTTRVHGTFGYLDPEYFQSSQFTAKSDVYSFGVVLVELLTGQKAVLPITFMEGRSLATYFMLSMKENRLFDILDAQVLKGCRDGEVVGVAYLANRCLNLNGRKRPTMKEVAMELEAIKTTHAGSTHFQVLHNEEVDGHGNTQLAGPFECTNSTSVTSLVGR